MTKGKIVNLEGYVIRLADYKDNDAMVTFVTDKDTYSFLARGIKKPTSKNRASMALLAKSKLSLIQTDGTYVLKESQPLSYPDAKDDFSRSVSLMFIAELCSKMIQGEEAEAIYPWLDATMSAIETIGNDSLSIALIFLAQVLRIEGYGLNVDGCVVCGKKKDIVGISLSDGGFLCREDLEYESQKRDVRILKILRYIFRCGPNDIARVSFERKECKFILDDLTKNLEEMTGIKLRSLELVKKI